MHRLITLIFVYFSDKIKEDRFGRICSIRGIGKKFINIFITNPKEKRPQGLLSLIKLYLIGIVYDKLDCALLNLKGSSVRGFLSGQCSFWNLLSGS
jgi:hypothetical protein